MLKPSSRSAKVGPGSIPASADSKEHAYPPGKHESTLTSACRQRNEELIRSLKADANESELLKQTEADAACGRMTHLVEVAELGLANVLLARRFSRVQGVRDDGS